MVPSDWDSAPRCVCGPNFISDFIGESPIFPAARSIVFRALFQQTNKQTNKRREEGWVTNWQRREVFSHKEEGF